MNAENPDASQYMWDFTSVKCARLTISGVDDILEEWEFEVPVMLTYLLCGVLEKFGDVRSTQQEYQ